VSAIAGILNLDGTPVEAARLHRMAQALNSPGLHAAKPHFNSSAGFIQLSRNPAGAPGTRPLVHPHRTWLLAFDGRFDNRADLQRRLGLEVAADFTIDWQLVLHAYEKWGPACPQYLLGDFAFALWDSQVSSLFCARDHFGVKPFYYYSNPKVFVFASSPEAILASGLVSSAIHTERIADFLVGLEGIDTTSTFYEHIYRLPHGHTLQVTTRALTLNRYWQLAPAQVSGITTQADYLEAFSHHFFQAVRSRIGDPISTAVSLSGGLDSSAIFAVTRQVSTQAGRPPILTASFISPQDTANPETCYIQLLLKQEHAPVLTVTSAQAEERMDGLVALLTDQSEPFDWHMNFWRLLYSQAAAAGIHSMLDGVDGDLLLANASLASYLWRTGQVRAALGETLFAGGLMANFYPPWRMLLQSLWAAFRPEWVGQIGRRLVQIRAMPGALKSSLIHSDFARQVRLTERLALYRTYSVNPDPHSHPEAHCTVFSHPHLQAALERYNRVASACAIQPLHPLLDVPLAEFCLALPWQLKIQRGWTKLAMRRMLEPLLPAEVVWRKDKSHLGWSVNRLVLKSRPELFRQVLAEERDRLGEYIDLAKLDRCWHHTTSSGKDTHAGLIWDAVALAFWLRRQRGLHA
jgi:asparagine synthase (glutamine-hydrolysing)